MKRVVCLASSIVMLFTVCFSFAYAKDFSDVDSTHWAYQYINELSDGGVINGYQDGTFKPSGTITRGEFLKLVVACCMPKNIDLSDAEGKMDHWAANYVWIAETYGVLGINEININNINEPITRIEMARLVSKADMIMRGSSSQYTTELEFMDVALLNMENLYLLRHAVGRGLIKGYDDGTFKPDKTMTRAEAATMIYRLSKI